MDVHQAAGTAVHKVLKNENTVQSRHSGMQIGRHRRGASLDNLLRVEKRVRRAGSSCAGRNNRRVQTPNGCPASAYSWLCADIEATTGSEKECAGAGAVHAQIKGRRVHIKTAASLALSCYRGGGAVQYADGGDRRVQIKTAAQPAR
jgi:hypothetical protein